MDFNVPSNFILEQTFIVSIPDRDFSGFQPGVSLKLIPNGFYSIPDRDFSGFQLEETRKRLEDALLFNP